MLGGCAGLVAALVTWLRCLNHHSLWNSLLPGLVVVFLKFLLKSHHLKYLPTVTVPLRNSALNLFSIEFLNIFSYLVESDLNQICFPVTAYG